MFYNLYSFMIHVDVLYASVLNLAYNNVLPCGQDEVNAE